MRRHFADLGDAVAVFLDVVHEVPRAFDQRDGPQAFRFSKRPDPLRVQVNHAGEKPLRDPEAFGDRGLTLPARDALEDLLPPAGLLNVGEQLLFYRVCSHRRPSGWMCRNCAGPCVGWETETLEKDRAPLYGQLPA